MNENSNNIVLHLFEAIIGLSIKLSVGKCIV